MKERWKRNPQREERRNKNKLAWRNWIAHWTSNPEVVGSSPTVSFYSFTLSHFSFTHMHSFQQQNHSFIQTAHIQQLVKNWDGLHTSTTSDQETNEEKCAFYWIDAGSLSEEERLKRFKTGYWDASGKVVFMRDAHIAYLRRHCGELGTRYMSQASRYWCLVCSFMNSKPWLYFHVLNSLDLLNSEDISLYEGATASVNACYCGGGYAGSELEVEVLCSG